jgi:hypothetical protein
MATFCLLHSSTPQLNPQISKSCDGRKYKGLTRLLLAVSAVASPPEPEPGAEEAVPLGSAAQAMRVRRGRRGKETRDEEATQSSCGGGEQRTLLALKDGRRRSDGDMAAAAEGTMRLGRTTAVHSAGR